MKKEVRPSTSLKRLANVQRPLNMYNGVLQPSERTQKILRCASAHKPRPRLNSEQFSASQKHLLQTFNSESVLDKRKMSQREGFAEMLKKAIRQAAPLYFKKTL